MTLEAQQIIRKLEHIQSDINFIKQHVVDVDLVLTSDDIKALYEADDDLKKGKTKRL